MFKGITYSSSACLSSMHLGGYFAARSGTFGQAKFSPLSAPHPAFSILPLRFLSFKSWPEGENILRLCIQTLRGQWRFIWGIKPHSPVQICRKVVQWVSLSCDTLYPTWLLFLACFSIHTIRRKDDWRIHQCLNPCPSCHQNPILTPNRPQFLVAK